MAQKAPGKHFRKGMSLIDIMRMFPDNATAEAWFVKIHWPHGPACPHCGSTNVLSGAKHSTMPYRCREKECRKRFSVRTGTVMQSSNLGYQIWAMAIYLCLTSLKGLSSMKLHRDLNITQKSAWHLAHRLRKALESRGGMFSGPVEVDETYMGGKRRNMSNAKRKELAGTGRGSVGKVAVVGAKDRASNRVAAKVVTSTDKPTLQGFVVEHAAPGATVYSDEASRLRRHPLRARERQAQRFRVRSRHGAYERHGGLLEHVEAGAYWHFPQDEPEASRPLRDGIRGSPQHARARHNQPNGLGCARNGRQAAQVRRPNRRKRSRLRSAGMSDYEKSDRPVVNLVKSTYQPSKAELEEIIDLGDTDPEDVARALLRPVGVRVVSRPNTQHPSSSSDP